MRPCHILTMNNQARGLHLKKSWEKQVRHALPTVAESRTQEPSVSCKLGPLAPWAYVSSEVQHGLEIFTLVPGRRAEVHHPTNGARLSGTSVSNY